MTLPEPEIERIAEALADPGYTISQELFAPERVAQLRGEALSLQSAGTLTAAGTGAQRRLAHSETDVIRGDSIAWLDPQKLSLAQQSYWGTIMELAEALGPRLYLPIRDHEAHYAVYPPGTGYARHIDQLRGSGARLLSCVLYLNDPDWQPRDGGQLRIYTEDRDDSAQLDIQPEGGTFVIFRSDTVWHAVLPATRTRVSLTGWMRRA
jgi:SM-20-related protein